MAGRYLLLVEGSAMNSGRTSWRQRLVIVLVLGAMLVPGVGCTQLLFTAAYLWRGNDTPAECNKLRDKRVAVVCRSVVTLQYRNARVDQDLAQEVSALLKKNVPKIKMVEHRKVAEWMDEHTWEEYTEVGKAVNADLVVGIDLESFDLNQSQTLLQGRANAEIKVYDCHTGKVVFKKRLPPSVYPPNRVVQASEVPESEFRREFTRILADQVARHFYDHDPYSDFALDAKSI
jgi:hypothetical protein